MRRYLLLLCCIFLCSYGHAQKTVRYAGYVQMPSDPLVSYYLELTINENQARGYSITGYKDGNRLKASVEGYFTTPSDLYIKETGSLDGPNSGIQTYCYFSAHLKLTVMMNGRQRWNGAFESRQANGAPCIGSGGIMTVMDNAPPLEDVPKPKPNITRAEVPRPPQVQRVPKDTPRPAPPKPAPPKPVAVEAKPKDTPRPVTIVKAAPEPAPKPAAQPTVVDSCQRTFDWNSNELAFDIWDGWKTDGDVVSVHINGNKLLDHEKLSGQKQRFKVSLKPGLNVLYIALFEEGYDPPNTPNLTLYDGSKEYELAISGEVGEIARICIWRK